MRSWLRMILETAAAISGVMPGARRASTSVVAASDSSQSRNSPTVMCDDRREGRRVVASMMRRRDVVVFVGNDRLGQEPLQRHVRQRHLGGDVLLGVVAATPASTSPERGGVALAISSFRSKRRKPCRLPALCTWSVSDPCPVSTPSKGRESAGRNPFCGIDRCRDHVTARHHFCAASLTSLYWPSAADVFWNAPQLPQ